ncbi:MAG: hypothetical protein HDT40_03725 [Lachnospiraceae bacterium]|nr:hypothetical protein [Lachnospiraceae bacterium]
MMEISAVNFYNALYNSDSEIKNIKGEEFKNLFDKLTGGRMAEEIRENYNVTLDVGSVGSCYDLINSYDIRCTNYVRIAPQTLSNMEKNPALKNKVLNAIKEFCSKEEQMEIRALLPPVKSAGMIIYPDGRTLYWLEGYPNEPENEKDKRIITGEQPQKELLQKYHDMNYDVAENGQQNILLVMAPGYKKRIKERLLS